MTPLGYFIIEGSNVWDAFKNLIPLLPSYSIWIIGFYLCYFIFIPRLLFKKKVLQFVITIAIVYYLLGRLSGLVIEWMYGPHPEIKVPGGVIWLGTMIQTFVNMLLVFAAIALKMQHIQTMKQQDEQEKGISTTPQQTTENTNTPEHTAPNYIFVKCEYKQVRIDLDDIMYISAMKDYVQIRLVGQQMPITALSTLKAIEEKLPDDRFCRVHRSHIVAINKIESVENNRIKMAEQLIPISETYQEKFYEMI